MGCRSWTVGSAIRVPAVIVGWLRRLRRLDGHGARLIAYLHNRLLLLAAPPDSGPRTGWKGCGLPWARKGGDNGGEED